MKVLHISTYDNFGGAAKACKRLHQSLLQSGIDSFLLVQKKTISSPRIIGPTNRWEKIQGLVRPQLDDIWIRNKKTKAVPFTNGRRSSKNIVKKVRQLDPDVVHLHWVGNGMLGISDLLEFRKPIVCSLHDMWFFTGGCHYTDHCEGFKKNCGCCPVFNSTDNNDISYKNISLKKKVYDRLDKLVVVGSSSWISNEGQRSYLLGDKTVINLPTPINCQEFFPVDKSEARKLLNLDPAKQYIVFGAIDPGDDLRKGYSELINSLKYIDHGKNVELCIFGANESEELVDKTTLPVRFFGHLYDDISLNLLYNAGDVMVVPSLQENLANTILESLSSGTPVVAFDIGGNKDMIDHKTNGFLAQDTTSESLADGINWILKQEDTAALRQAAVEKVKNHFSYSVVAKKYTELYKSIVRYE